MANQLVLDQRWGYVAVAVALAFLARLLYLLRPGLRRATSAAGRLAGCRATLRSIRAATIAGIVLLVAFPFLVMAAAGPTGAIKWIDNFAIQILIYVMLGWGLNIVVGLAGLLDLGYVAFYAIGAYAFALLAQHFDLGFWICLPLAGILAAFWGVLLGFPVLRLRGDYLAIVTLAFGEIIRLVAINWVDLTRGYAGISGVPRATFFGLPFEDSDQGFAAFFGLEFATVHRTIFFFYVILGLAAMTNWVTLRLRRLPVGRAWEALREDETACRSLGINTTNTKLTAFALGAMFGGLAGAFYVTSRGQGFVTPESFTFMESALILGHRRAGRAGQPGGRRHRRRGPDRRHRVAARARMDEADLRARFRADALPHADFRAGHGAGHDLEAARRDLHAHAVHLPAAAGAPCAATSSGRATADGRADGPAAHGRASHHALRRSRCHRRSVVLRQARRDHRRHRPQRRRQDHGLQLRDGLLQAHQRAHGAEPRRALRAGDRRAHRLGPGLAHHAGPAACFCWSACATSRSPTAPRLPAPSRTSACFPA